jgi:hypothetical protein
MEKLCFSIEASRVDSARDSYFHSTQQCLPEKEEKKLLHNEINRITFWTHARNIFFPCSACHCYCLLIVEAGSFVLTSLSLSNSSTRTTTTRQMAHIDITHPIKCSMFPNLFHSTSHTINTTPHPALQLCHGWKAMKVSHIINSNNSCNNRVVYAMWI